MIVALDKMDIRRLMTIDLSKLNIKRLKSYRKSLIPNIARWETCAICGHGCEDVIAHKKDNPYYIADRMEYDRVNKALAERQKKKGELNASHTSKK